MARAPGSERVIRQLLIGVDAMEWGLIEPWADRGILPGFQRLLRTGARVRLASFADCLPDTVWTTLSYGVNPGKLEKYFYVQYDPRAAALRYAPDPDLRGAPFWRYLGQAGRRVGVVDVPHLPFQEIPNGFQLMSWGAHDNKSGAVASPPALLGEVQTRFGRHPVGDCERHNKGRRALPALRRAILAGVRSQGEVFRWLMQSRPWDVFVCCFSGAHCAGHHFWSHMDPAHPLHDPRDPAGVADTVEETYRAIDREIGALLDLAGPDTRTLVFAPHGMGPLSHASWNLNEILDLLGYGRHDGRGAAAAGRRARVNPWRIAKMLIPARWQYALKDRLPRPLQDRLLYLWYAAGRRYRGRRAFSVPNNEVTGAIRLAVRGRDHGGQVEPGAAYQRLRLEITQALEELTDPATGRRVVAKVTPLHEVFHGPFVGGLPDLAVLWDSSFPWDAVRSPRFGTLRLGRQDRRTGSHTPSAFLLAVGPGVPAGATLPGRDMLDLAPTVLEGAGLGIPGQLDGRPLPFAAARGA